MASWLNYLLPISNLFESSGTASNNPSRGQQQGKRQGNMPYRTYKMPESSWWESLMGKAPEYMQTDVFTPQQGAALQEMLRMGLQGTQNLQQHPFDFGPIAENAKRGFYESTVPTLAERFSSFGGPHAQGMQQSSAFGQQLGAAGAGLSSELASLGAQYGLQNQGQQMNYLTSLLGMGMTPAFQGGFTQGQEGFLPGLWNRGSQAVGQMAPVAAKMAMFGL
jgi:hypothetical protein